MAIRCKLISPTNLLLEHPMLSPVKETEFVVMGKTEWEKEKFSILMGGAMFGAFLAGLVCVLAVIFALARIRGQNRPNAGSPSIDWPNTSFPAIGTPWLVELPGYATGRHEKAGKSLQ